MARTSWVLLTVVLSWAGAARAAEPRAPGPSAAADPAVAASVAGPPPLYRDPATGMELVLVQGGCYQMGDASGLGKLVSFDAGDGGPDSEAPVHEVCLDSFYIGKYEVTNEQWNALMPKIDTDPARGRHPVMAPWKDIQAFIAKLDQGGAARFRLPTEAEWEYAARSRGRTDQRYSGGNDVESVSWYGENSHEGRGEQYQGSHPVGQKLPNALGLYDMSGNEWELTGDWMAPYAVTPRDNPTGPRTGRMKVKRGGCSTGSAVNQRTTMRDPVDPATPSAFRLVRVP